MMAVNGSGPRPWRTALEVLSGVLAAVPVGIWLYFMSILIWAEVITLLAIPAALVPHVGPQIIRWLSFSVSVTPILVAGAAAAEVWFCRVLIRWHHPVFAYTQAALGLAVSLPFFYWTAVHHKPLLPFWRQ